MRRVRLQRLEQVAACRRRSRARLVGLLEARRWDDVGQVHHPIDAAHRRGQCLGSRDIAAHDIDAAAPALASASSQARRAAAPARDGVASAAHRRVWLPMLPNAPVTRTFIQRKNLMFSFGIVGKLGRRPQPLGQRRGRPRSPARTAAGAKCSDDPSSGRRGRCRATASARRSTRRGSSSSSSARPKGTLVGSEPARVLDGPHAVGEVHRRTPGRGRRRCDRPACRCASRTRPRRSTRSRRRSPCPRSRRGGARSGPRSRWACPRS